jgi:S1-C subfamily serine protease
MTDIQNLLAGEGGVDLAPVVENGKQVAMRIFGVTPGTTAARLGAQNGDTIESINDVPLSSIAAAYDAGYRASRESLIVIRGMRAGTPYTTVLVVGNS